MKTVLTYKSETLAVLRDGRLASTHDSAIKVRTMPRDATRHAMMPCLLQCSSCPVTGAGHALVLIRVRRLRCSCGTR